MKKVFVAIFCLFVFVTGTAMAGTVIAMRGDGTVVFIDDKSEEIVGRVVTGGVAGAMGAVTPDGKLLYVANSGEGQYMTSIIDVEKRALIKNLPTGPAPSHAYVSPDGSLAATGHRLSEDGKLIVVFIDTTTHSIKHQVRIPLQNTAYKGTLTPHITWTRDSKYLFVPNWGDNVVHIINAQEGKEAVRLQLDGNPHNFSQTHDGKEMWVSVDAVEDATGKKVGCGKIYVFDLSAVLATPPVTTPKAGFCLTTKDGEPQEGHHVVFTRDGKYAYATNRGGPPFGGTSINVFDIETKKLVAHLTAGSNGAGHPFMSPDGRYVVVGHYGANTITIIDAKEHKVVKGLTVGTGKGVQWIAFTPDNKKAFVNNVEDDAVYVIDMKNLEVKKKIETAEPEKKWKTQWHVLNGWYQTYEVVETSLK